MAAIRRITVQNFRSIRSLVWHPRPGVNCLFGPGDSGKSSVLDAIELSLAANPRQEGFSDTDFNNLQVDEPIVIEAVIGELDDRLKSLEAYGEYLRGWDADRNSLSEPDESAGLEAVLVRRLEVRGDLEGRWQLLAEGGGTDDRDLRWEYRQRLAAARVGAYSTQHLAFGRRSILSRLAGPEFAGATALASAARHARAGFAAALHGCLDDIVAKVQGCAREMNVPAAGIQALLDAHSAAVSQTGVALHDQRQVPLSALGTGSSRLLVAALQRRDAKGLICLVDEVEYALEPYRIVRLLQELGPNSGPGQQVFLTTHSPVVLRELDADQLFRLRPTADAEAGSSHEVEPLSGGAAKQKALRACAEAFLSPSVIVCEGKTEIGLLRGLDRHAHEVLGCAAMASLGVYPADGGGSSMFERAGVFASLGYRAALFLDGDKPSDDQSALDCENRGVSVFRWPTGKSTEQVIFECAPAADIPALLGLAVEHRGSDSVDGSIKKADASLSLTQCQNCPRGEMGEPLGRAAKGRGGREGWFKDIEIAERVGREVVGPHVDEFGGAVKEMFGKFNRWIKPDGTG